MLSELDLAELAALGGPAAGVKIEIDSIADLFG